MLATPKVILLVLAINLLAGGAYAAAIQSTAADSTAVYKTDRVLGYDVTGIVFDLNNTNPDVIDSITFHIAPSSGSVKAGHVQVQTQAGGKWTECTLVDDGLPARAATCTFGSLAAEEVTALNIVAR